MVTKSSVFEDISGAIALASSPRLTPNGKFIAVKYHWFCSQTYSDSNGSKTIPIKKFDNKVNPRDIFTKIYSKESYLYLLEGYCVCGKEVVGNHPL